MKRKTGAALLFISAFGCGEESPPQSCPSGPDFGVTVTSVAGSLPRSTLVEVTFGGGSHESYSPQTTSSPSVLFCKVLHAEGADEGGAGGGGAFGSDAGLGAAGGHSSIARIDCDLWTRGPATIMVKAFAWQVTRDLKRENDVCYAKEAIVLGAPPSKP
jgi:hypothetical protein